MQSEAMRMMRSEVRRIWLKYGEGQAFGTIADTKVPIKLIRASYFSYQIDSKYGVRFQPKAHQPAPQ